MHHPRSHREASLDSILYRNERVVFARLFGWFCFRIWTNRSRQSGRDHVNYFSAIIGAVVELPTTSYEVRNPGL